MDNPALTGLTTWHGALVRDELTPEAALVRVPGAVLSHETAARFWGIELVDDDGRQRLTVPRNNGRYAVVGWHVHRSDLADDDIVTVGGLRLTSLARTLRDLGVTLALDRAVAAFDSALRQRLINRQAVDLLAARARGPGAGRVRRAVGLADPGSGSVLESLMRVLLVLAGLSGFRTQHVVRSGRVFVARVDFCWPALRLIVETDGFAFHSDRAAYRKDRERMNELERLGWRVLRFTWEDVVARPASVVELIRECMVATVAAA